MDHTARASDPLPDGALSFAPQGTARVAGRDMPVRWRIDWPEQGLALQTEPVNPQAWMDLTVSYWEGRSSSPAAITGAAIWK